MSDLFPDLPASERQVAPKVEGRGQPPLRARTVPETDCWTIEDHVCKMCFGRIVSRVANPERVFMCTDCGSLEYGAMRTDTRLHPKMCACSMRVGPRDAGVRCTVNDNPTPELPQRIIARQVK